MSSQAPDWLIIVCHLWGVLFGGWMVWWHMSRKIREEYVPRDKYIALESEATQLARYGQAIAQQLRTYVDWAQKVQEDANAFRGAKAAPPDYKN